MTRRFAFVSLLLAIMLILSACGNELESGVVIDKSRIPDTSGTVYLWTGGIMAPKTISRPAQYKICVQGIGEEDSDTIEWWDVDAVTYGRIQIGMHVRGSR